MINKLISYGLTEKEAQVYLAAMELGPSPVQKIARQAHINRVSAYTFIEQLIEKGLMSTYQKEKRTMYVASEPEALYQFFEQRRRELDSLEENLKKDLPELRSKYNASESSPKVRYYEGMDGVIGMSQEILQTNHSHLYTLYDFDITEKYFNATLRKKLQNARVEKKRPITLLYNAEEKTFESNELRTAYKISKDFHFPADIAIIDDRVRFISFSNKISGIVIEDKQIAESLMSLIKLALQSVKSNKKPEVD